MRERKSLEIMLKITVFLITFSLCAPAVGKIIYVDAGAVGVNDGSGWENAYIFLQEALADANSADKPVEIRVAQGIYRPDQGLIAISEFDWRTTSFQLISGVTLKGGYAGVVEPDPDARDVRGYETILSGDLAGNDVQVADPNDLLDEPTRSENSYNVVTCIDDTDETAVLDGFTITAGNANVPYLPIPPRPPRGGVMEDRGAGMYIHSSNPTLTHCIFTGNSAADSGGGISNRFGRSGSLTLTDCTFIGNSAGAGGGVSNQWYSSAILNNCTFIANEARYWGGAMYSFHQSKSTVNNCTFIGNSAEIGGGIYNEQHTELILTNCTLTGNSARRNGNGIVCSSSQSSSNDVELTNCIFWDDGDEIWNEGGSTITISYSNIQGGPAGVYDPFETVIRGEGNIDTDPLFADPDGPDNIPDTEYDDLRLSPISPCVDAGDPDYIPEPNETDLVGNPRIVSGRIDMGAHEFQGLIYVDDDASEDPEPGDPQVSDPLENGAEPHPMDSIQEAIDWAKDGYTVLVRRGQYLKPQSDDTIDFFGKNITLKSSDPTNWDTVNSTVIRGSVQFSGSENPNCKLTGFRIHDPHYGAIYGNNTRATISYCVISGNGPCGATVIKDCDGTISNCLITDNTTFFFCGILPVVSGCDGLIKNCTIANNISGVSVGTATIENCIIYNNAGSQLGVNMGETLSISYSNVQGGLEAIVGDGDVVWGPGNIDTDPRFVRLGYWSEEPLELTEGDYHLRSEGWHWNTEGKSWTYDYVTSPCIDAGDPDSPLADELLSVPRDPDNEYGVNLRINMGAFGGTRQASMPPYGWTPLADLNNDGRMDLKNIAALAENWLQTEGWVK